MVQRPQEMDRIKQTYSQERDAKKDVATRWNSQVIYGIRCIEWLGCGFKDFVSSPLIP